MIRLQFFSLEGKFRIVKTENFPNVQAAFEAAKEYGTAAGFTNIKLATDKDDLNDSFRVTGKTPGGRSGRNIASGDDYGESEESDVF